MLEDARGRVIWRKLQSIREIYDFDRGLIFSAFNC